MARRALDPAFRDEELPIPPATEPYSRERCLDGLSAARTLASGACWGIERRRWEEVEQRWLDRLDRLDQAEARV